MKKIIILGLGVAAFFMQGCDFLDRTPEDIIETGKFFESANANALEQYCNDFYPKLINGHGAPKGTIRCWKTTGIRTIFFLGKRMM